MCIRDRALTIADSLKFGKEVLEKLGNHNNLHKNRVEQVGFAVVEAAVIPYVVEERALKSDGVLETKLETARLLYTSAAAE
ncbi:hypothetical protein Q8G09_25825, partial [Klebsiella pneumoniae]|nr:hypothetical protein [Klebsiella pneumoniae]